MVLQLSEFHRTQLQSYIRFFRSKREVQVGELAETFADAIDSRLDDGALMSAQEVAALLTALGASVRAAFEDDLKRTVSMSVLAIQQLFEDADAQSVELSMDTSKIEDIHLVSEVEKLAALDRSVAERKAGTGRLVSLRDEQRNLLGRMQDQEEQMKRLDKEREAVQDKLDAANAMLSNATYETVALRRQLEQLRAGAAAARSEEEAKAKEVKGKQDAARAVTGLQGELDVVRDEVSTLRAELADALQLLGPAGVAALNDVKNSRQFVQLKKTLTQKTEQLTDLRRRLIVHEPDETREELEANNMPLKIRHK
jgi:chromosome segregation ATPase